MVGEKRARKKVQVCGKYCYSRTLHLLSENPVACMSMKVLLCLLFVPCTMAEGMHTVVLVCSRRIVRDSTVLRLKCRIVGRGRGGKGIGLPMRLTSLPSSSALSHPLLCLHQPHAIGSTWWVCHSPSLKEEIEQC